MDSYDPSCPGRVYVLPVRSTHPVFYRVLWIAMILAALAVFMYYLSDRLILYFEYQKTVNVEVNYVDSMEFPAISICNENVFK